MHILDKLRCFAPSTLQGLLDASDCLQLLLLAYSLAGGVASSPFTLAEERQLKEALASALEAAASGGAGTVASSGTASPRAAGAAATAAGGGDALRAVPHLRPHVLAPGHGSGGADAGGGEYQRHALRLALQVRVQRPALCVPLLGGETVLATAWQQWRVILRSPACNKVC